MKNAVILQTSTKMCKYYGEQVQTYKKEEFLVLWKEQQEIKCIN